LQLATITEHERHVSGISYILLIASGARRQQRSGANASTMGKLPGPALLRRGPHLYACPCGNTKLAKLMRPFPRLRRGDCPVEAILVIILIRRTDTPDSRILQCSFNHVEHSSLLTSSSRLSYGSTIVLPTTTRRRYLFCFCFLLFCGAVETITDDSSMQRPHSSPASNRSFLLNNQKVPSLLLNTTGFLPPCLLAHLYGCFCRFCSLAKDQIAALYH
jgi:hypothetical protein